MMGKKELKIVSQEEYLLDILKMTPGERLKKCFQLSEWSVKLNAHFNNEIAWRIKDCFVLE